MQTPYAGLQRPRCVSTFGTVCRNESHHRKRLKNSSVYFAVIVDLETVFCCFHRDVLID